MSLLFFDGFDLVPTIGTTMAIKGWSSTISGFIQSTGRVGGFSLVANHSSGGTLYRTTSNAATLFVGFAIKFTTFVAGNLFVFYDEASIQIIVKMDATGKLYFTNGAGTVLTDTISSNIKLVLGVWSFVEIMVTINNSIGSNSNIVRIDGVEVCNLASGQDTQATANAYTNKVLYQVATSAALFDDFYLCDSSGTTNNTFLGDVRTVVLTPTGNGNYSQFTGSDSNSVDNYLLVDELPVNTTDYVDSSTLNQMDSYAFSNMPVNTISIYGLQRTLYCTKTDVGTRRITPFIRIGSTDYLAGTEIDLVTPWNQCYKLFELDPSISAAWNKTNVDDAEFGFKVTT